MYGLAAGCFPQPVSLGGRAVGWIEAEVDEWVREQIAESRFEGGRAGERGEAVRRVAEAHPIPMMRRVLRRSGDSRSDGSTAGEPAAVLNTAAGEGVAPPPLTPRPDATLHEEQARGGTARVPPVLAHRDGEAT
ncbi:helix-turn-helix transcriptional regulator [Candidatus Palauibacter sp.]|uniref:helix-turn-helix transcriptional regulator n=1 Tax=Candidatus Palauibacter sp. TaxID=3101350 RepID=UPI003B52CD5C